MRECRENFKLAKNLLKFGFWKWNIEKDIIKYSDKFYETLGLERYENKIEDLCYPEDRNSIKESYYEAVAKKKKEFIAKKRLMIDGFQIRYLEYIGEIKYNKEKSKTVFGVCKDITEEKNMKKDLEVKDKAMSNSLSSIALTDTKGIITYCNKAFLELFEFNNFDEVLGRNVTNFMANPEKAKQREKELIEKGELKGEIEIITGKNNKKKLEFYSTLITDDDGKATSMMAWFDEITEDEIIQKKYEEIIQEAPIGIFQTTLEGEVIFANPALAEMLGCKNIDEVYRNYKDISHDLYFDPKRRKEFIKKIQKKGKLKNFEFRVKDKFENIKRFSMTCKIKTVDEKKIIEGFVVDTTDKRRLEKRYRDILANAPIGIFTTTLQGKILSVNREALDVLGYDDKDDLKENVGNVKNLYVDKNTRKKLMNKLKEVGEVRGMQARYICKDGSKIWGSISSKIKKDVQKDRLLVDSFIKNIEKQKKYEGKLKKERNRSKKEAETKDKFLSLIGHDLKNMLSASNMLLEYLLNNIEKIDREELKKMVSMEEESSKRALDFLNNILVWGRSQTGDIELVKEEFFLKEILNNIMMIYGMKFEKKNIKFSNEIKENFKMYADKNMLEIIIGNLISNSLKFTNKGGEIKIKTERMNDKTRISVIDNGIGMEKEVAENIFNLEHALSTQGTEKERGTGLGLKIVKEFVERHEGKIWAESRIGHGSKFTFEI